MRDFTAEARRTQRESRRGGFQPAHSTPLRTLTVLSLPKGVSVVKITPEKRFAALSRRWLCR